MFEPKIKTIFYKFTDDIASDWILENNILHIKGSESLVPGVLEKTLRAFSIFKNEEFDYLVRSNVSTIINFDLLISELERNPIHFYGGGRVENLQWEGGGITDNTWYGTNFVCGTGIILTRYALNYILNNEQLIHKNIVDDVAIAILFREHRPDIQAQQINPKYYHFTPCFFIDDKLTIDHVRKYIQEFKIIFYRNRNFNRKMDEIQIQLITHILMEQRNHTLSI